MLHPDMAEDEDFVSIPFDPAEGIHFKYGTSYADPAVEQATFEAHYGIRLPRDFVKMIGDWCEGGFDGWYRVIEGKFGRVVWHHLLLMKLASKEERADRMLAPRNIDHVLKKHAQLFRTPAGERIHFPFGEALVIESSREIEGYLAFDLRDSMAIVFLLSDGGEPRPIADTFGAMMSGATFEHFG